VDHVAERDDGHVGARPFDRGDPDGHQRVAVRHVLGDRIDAARLEEDDRVVVADGALEQATRIGRARGQDHFQAGQMGVERVAGLRVLGRRAGAVQVAGPEDDGEIALAAKHVADLARLVDYLGERHRAPVDDRPEAATGCPHGDAGHGGLGDGHAADAGRPQLLEQSGRGRGGHGEDALVTAHLLGHRRLQGAGEVHGGHLFCPLVALTPGLSQEARESIPELSERG
jgi:hypothetical protein